MRIIHGMKADFSRIFHTSSKDGSKGHHPIPKDFSEWPDEWKTTYYKVYPRMPQILLPAANLAQNLPLANAIQERVTTRDFSDKALTLQELSLLLRYSCGNISASEKERFRRAQPSGGARFPIETYYLNLKKGELNPGLYHYNVKNHLLEYIFEKKFTPAEIDQMFSYEWVKNSSGIIFMTANFLRSQIKYGERGYRYILLEAGHIGQNIYLISSALRLACCALGGTKDIEIENKLDIDGSTESLVYALAIGK